jgi:hypothetical protein
MSKSESYLGTVLVSVVTGLLLSKSPPFAAFDELAFLAITV